ncbi:DNA-binding protein YbaB [Nocardioides ginsengisegetis]|uniref:DNA-binding protein YbaB n=1 Tax=Nocardioides ginsengisegetis TaxID=661491 RepID=A0A7W3J0T1_9ACTN|nr:YbaB/EbfC family nucleoid-associated protein [Nocardioides ginsengisegetis]MBA8804212.1 DNA-binding protein YbaB [Nocardioides ginsengisegetis]
MFTSEEEALASVDRAVAEARAHAIRAQALSVDLDALRVTGQSRDGAAEVTLSHTGAVTDVYFGRRLENAGLDQLRTAFLQANAAAQSQLAARVTELSGRAFGDDSATTRELAARYRQMFPPAEGGSDHPGVLR